MRLRKILWIILVIISSVFIGCKNSNEKELFPEEIVEQQGQLIMENITNKDTSGLRELFCERIKSKDNVGDELAGAFNFISGEIISYDEVDVSLTGKKNREWGVLEERFSGKVKNIKTDTNKTYEIIYGYYSVNTEHPEYVGISSLSIIDTDIYNEELGYPRHGRYDISKYE